MYPVKEALTGQTLALCTGSPSLRQINDIQRDSMTVTRRWMWRSLSVLGLCASIAHGQDGEVLARRGSLAPVLERDIAAALFARSPSVQKQLLDEPSALRQIAEEILLTRAWERVSEKYGSTSPEALYIRNQVGIAAVKAGADIAEREARLTVPIATIEARAKEIWLRDQKAYAKSAAATVTALQIDVGARGYDASVKRWAQINREIKRKIPFATVAQTWTDDRKAKRKERSVTFRVEASQADGDLYKAVFETLAVGVVSEPIATRFGWLVLQVNEREAPSVIPFEEAKLDIVEKVLSGIAAEARNNFLASLRNEPPVFFGRLATETKTEVTPSSAIRLDKVIEAAKVNGAVDAVKLQDALRQAQESIKAATVNASGGATATPTAAPK
jgi:hypothetical protein